MEIVKRGWRFNMNDEWSTLVVCKGHGVDSGKGCGSIILVKENDLKLMSEPRYYCNGYNWLYTVCCPLCQQLTEVPFKNLSDDLQNEILRRKES